MDIMAAADPAEELAEGNAMDDTELLSILGAHEASAIGFEPGSDDEISAAQERALDYYNGHMDDVPAAEGTSSVVDGTVALVVDNAVAALLKPFVSSDETVMFAPRGPEDIETAEQATEYVNYVFNCDNPGFSILHDWFKDALLSKLGVVKVWWEDEPRLETVQTVIADELHAEFLRAQPNYLGEDGGIAYHGEEIADGRVKVEVVPPEEFRISGMAKSVDKADYTAHVPSNFTRSDAHEMGFDADIVESLPAYGETDSDNSLRQSRYRDENLTDSRSDAPHKANDRLAFRDEYVRLDYDGDGVTELRRIMRVGDVILYNEEVDDNPFATLCPIPMPHKVFGHSLADRSIQEQKIGTVLWRQMLDNLYKSNNPRPIVGQGAILEDGSTAESLMDNAPGAAIMLKDASQFNLSDAVKFTGHQSFPMLELLDKKVEENTGISRAGQGLDTNALRKSGQTTATEMSLIAQGKNARTEMIARIFAETGVSRLFKLVLKLVTKHQPRERIIRLRNKWVPMDPRGWPEMDVQISVGLGMGDKSEQMLQGQTVLEAMERIGGTPFASLIDQTKVYNALKRLFNAAGIKNIDDFLNEPEEGQMMPQQPSPEEMKAQAEMQMQQAKLQGEQQLAALRIQLQEQEAAAKQELERQKAEFEAQQAERKMAFEMQMAEAKFSFEQRMADRKATHEETKLSDNRSGGDLDK